MKISERIRIHIENNIQDGTLLPGDPIDEDLLIAQFASSRTPVREALLQLQAQGLLASLPRSGMVVAKMDVQQLLAMWELLAELESLAARYACERMSQDERLALARIHEEAAAIAQRNDLENWQRVNLAFHECVYKGARNPYLRQEIMRMRARTGAYRRHAFGAVSTVQASYDTHGELLHAVLQGDSATAARTMFLHMSPRHGARGVTDFIVSLPDELLLK